tara:strand:- start:507 stop:2249 length:1743 start_codon:yes stop_codon:yes gene_type:complete
MAKNKPVGNLKQPGLQPQARPIDAFAGGGTQQAGTGAGQLAEALGVAAEVAEDIRKRKEEEDLRLVDFYADQFMKDKEAGLADKVAVGELFPDKSSIIKSRITEAIGKRYATEQARNMMDELLADENLRYDSDARRLFYEQKKQQLSEEIKDRPFFGAGALEGLNSVFNQFEYQLQQEGAKEHLETLRENYTSKLMDAMEDAKQGGVDFDIISFEAQTTNTGLNKSTRKELFIDELIRRGTFEASESFKGLGSARPGKTAEEITESIIKAVPKSMRGDPDTELKLAKLKGDLISLRTKILSADQADENQMIFEANQKQLKTIFEAAEDKTKMEVLQKANPRDLDFIKTESGNEYQSNNGAVLSSIVQDGANPTLAKIYAKKYQREIQKIAVSGGDVSRQLNQLLENIAIDPTLNKIEKQDLVNNMQKYANAYEFVERAVSTQEKDKLKQRVQTQMDFMKSKAGFRERRGGFYLDLISDDDPLRFAENLYDTKLFDYITSEVQAGREILDANIREQSAKIFEEVQSQLRETYPILFNAARIKQLEAEGEVDIPPYQEIDDSPEALERLRDFVRKNPQLFEK